MPRRIGRHLAGGPEREPDPGAEREEAAREAFGRWATGVAIVAVRAEGRVHALTVSAVVPVSLDPPLMMVSLGGNASALPYLRTDTEFGISVLAASQRGIAHRYADTFPVGAPPFPPDGTPLVDGALEAITCTVHETLPCADHTFVIGRITAVRHGPPDAGPLLYYARQYRTLVGDGP